MDTPLGQLVLVGDERALHGVYFADGRRPALDGLRSAREPFVRAVAQLDEYFAGERQTFALALEPRATPFQRRVWDALLGIPFGVTRSYGEIARALGTGPRAVGLANGANPLSIVVPCHRLVAGSGALTGYGGGLERKRLLLEHERRCATFAR